MKEPESLKEHAHKYDAGAWRDYSIEELGQWVHLLVKRARMRSDSEPQKREKDLTDAQNYLNMIQANLDDAKGTK